MSRQSHEILLLHGGPGLSNRYFDTSALDDDFRIVKFEYLGCDEHNHGEIHSVDKILSQLSVLS